MKIRKKMMVAVLSAAIIAGISGTYGYFSDIVTVTNHIATGDVNISLKEYETKQGKETSYSNPKVVLPGDVISKIPRITNYAEPCWVRARISYENDREELEALSDDNLLGIYGQWMRHGEYYYYTQILNRGETVTLFQGIEIPSGWTEEHSDQNLKIRIQADAIQAANFQPDFSAMSPWGNQEIELCVHEENGAAVSKKSKVKLSVEFNGSAHKLVAVPDDFFANIGTAMPGDVFKDSVAISNTTKNPAEIFFHTGLVCQREDRMDLLRKLQLTISMDGKILYSGDLQAESLKSEVSLGKFQPGDGGTMEFAVSVPKELKNAYALRDTAVKWYFTVYEDEVQPSAVPENEWGQSSDPAKDRTAASSVSAVKTADDSPILLLLAAAVMSAVIGAVVLVAKYTIKNVPWTFFK
ncbi:MAG: TasA family protein [Eubacteriales bacterium]|nr:TasA family protein [Eubacteriales bacterium]